MMRKSKYWSVEDVEDLVYTTVYDAVEMYLDGLGSLRALKEIGVLKVYGYAPLLTGGLSDRYLEEILEDLDERYGNPDSDPSSLTEKMESAWEAFEAVVRSEYESWTCEVVETVEIDVQAWLKEHRSEWLKGKRKV